MLQYIPEAHQHLFSYRHAHMTGILMLIILIAVLMYYLLSKSDLLPDTESFALQEKAAGTVPAYKIIVDTMKISAITGAVALVVMFALRFLVPGSEGWKRAAYFIENYGLVYTVMIVINIALIVMMVLLYANGHVAYGNFLMSMAFVATLLTGITFFSHYKTLEMREDFVRYLEDNFSPEQVNEYIKVVMNPKDGAIFKFLEDATKQGGPADTVVQNALNSIFMKLGEKVTVAGVRVSPWNEQMKKLIRAGQILQEYPGKIAEAEGKIAELEKSTARGAGKKKRAARVALSRLKAEYEDARRLTGAEVEEETG